ncbi:MAG: hypothetical protein RL701_2693, partial [Pseudomonadota bacterium]
MADGSTTYVSTRSKLIGAALCAGCVIGCFLLMARQGQMRHAVLLGIPLLLGAVIGLCAALDLLRPVRSAFGATDTNDAVPLTATSLFPIGNEPRWCAPILTFPSALGVLVLVGARGASALPVAITAALCVLLLSALRRPALFVFVVASALYLPLLGSFGLWDPWETHYGEVSREILGRDDWVSLWWAQDGWFWSKPILIFWAEALTWSATGAGFRADSNP